MEVDKKSVGQNIRSIRLSMGMTTEEFGELLDATKGTVSKWENGKYLPNNKRLNNIAFYGQISVDELLQGDTVEVETIQLFRGGENDIRNYLIAGMSDENLEELQSDFEFDYSDIELIISRIGLYVDLGKLPKTMKVKRYEGDEHDQKNNF